MKKKLYTLFCLQYFVMFLTFGAITPFISTYITNELDGSNSDVGLLAFIGSIIIIFSVVIIGLIADYSKRYKMTLNIVLILSALSIFIVSNVNSFVMVVIFFTMYKFFSGTLTSLNDAITSYKANEENMNFGLIRTFGTLGYVMGSLVTGYLSSLTSEPKIFLYVALTVLIISSIIVCFYPKLEKSREPVNFKNIKKLFKNKNFIISVSISAFVFGTTSTASYFDPILLESFGRGDLKGIVALIQTIPEIILMPFAIIILYKIGYKNAFYISSISMIMRWSIIFVAPNHFVYFGATMLHGFAACFTLPIISTFIVKNVDDEVRSTAFAIHIAFISIINAIVGMLAGKFNDLFNDITIGYLVLLTSAIIGFGITFLFDKKESKI